MRPEMKVRKLVHSLGYRYRLHRKDLPGKPDLVFPKKKSVIFVHGCFWHQHGDPNCLDSRRPKSNTQYWDAKLARNVERDKNHIESLRQKGWRVLVIWGCETTDQTALREKLVSFLENHPGASSPG